MHLSANQQIEVRTVPEKMDRTTLESVCALLADTNKGLTGSQLIRLCKDAALRYGVFIPVEDTNFPEQGIPNKRTALYKNLDVFDFNQQMTIITECSWDKGLQDNGVGEEVRSFLERRYGQPGPSDNALAFSKDAKDLLNDLPKTRSAYEAVARAIKSGQYDRHVLDDSRFALEQLFQELFGNSASIENNLNMLGSALKGADVSPDLRNMITTLVKYYTNYQNNHVKHHDSASSSDYQFIIDFTLTTMRFVISALGKRNAQHSC